MKCPNNIRECPHGWTDCSLCANLKACQVGIYVPEPEPEPTESDLDVVIKAAEVSKKVVHAEAVKSVESIRGGSWYEGFSKLSPNDRLAEIMRYPIPNPHSVADPYKAERGAIVPGGGSKSRVPKKPQRKVPEYMKILGM